MTRCAWTLVAAACLPLAADLGQSAQKRPEISEREAHHLLMKFLKLPDRAVYRLRNDFGYKKFHFFQAEEGRASLNLQDPTLGVLHIRYYAMDRNTADLWDATFCREISSPALAQFQVVIRKHIWPGQHRISKP